MGNPFEASDGGYFVLRNSLNQHSLWPCSIAVPEGWAVAYGRDVRAACLEYVRDHWVDIEPSDVADFIRARRPAKSHVRTDP